MNDHPASRTKVNVPFDTDLTLPTILERLRKEQPDKIALIGKVLKTELRETYADL